MNLSDALDAFYREIHSAPRRKTGRARRGGCDTFRNFESKAMAVHPKQVKQARDRAKRHGIAVEYKDDGTAILQSPGARKALMNLEGLRDQSGFGGIYG